MVKRHFWCLLKELLKRVSYFHMVLSCRESAKIRGPKDNHASLLTINIDLQYQKQANEGPSRYMVEEHLLIETKMLDK